MEQTLRRMVNLPSQLTKSKSGPSAQDLIRMPGAAIKFGVLRKKPKYSLQNKWPRRFVMLLKDSVYIYKDELASEPRAQLLLQCYGKACPEECETHEWSFSLVADGQFSNMETKTFACLSEDERLGWVSAINHQLSVARADSAAYSDSYNSTGSYELSSSSDGSAGSLGRSAGSMGLSPTTRPYTPPPTRKPAVLPKPSLLPLSRLSLVPPKPLISLPPKPSELPPEPLEEDSEYDIPVFTTLEEQCTVVNNAVDRDDLLRQLKDTNLPGTYLIRNSRTVEDKILSYLAEDYTVKNYKIFKIEELYSLDRIKKFDTIENLLRNYTNCERLPNTKSYLQTGFFK